MAKLPELTKIYIAAYSDNAIQLGDAVPGFAGVEQLEDGGQYSCVVKNGVQTEKFIGTYSASSQSLTRQTQNVYPAGTDKISLAADGLYVDFVMLARDLPNDDSLRKILQSTQGASFVQSANGSIESRLNNLDTEIIDKVSGSLGADTKAGDGLVQGIVYNANGNYLKATYRDATGTHTANVSKTPVLDSLGESTTSAISQRAATDAVNTRVATIDADAGIASMQLDDNGNIVVTDKKGGNHIIVINSISGDAQTPTDTLYSITNYYVAKDGSLIARDSNGKLWSVPDKDYVTKVIADAGGSSTNKTYALSDMSNVTDGTFQARKLSTQQVINALGFTPLGSDADLSKYAEKDLSNVSAQTIQSLTFVSKQITDALGYVPAKQIDANNLALTDLSNVSTDTINKKLNFPVSGEDPTVASGGANNNNKAIRNLYAKTIDNGDTSKGAILPKGSVEYVLWALTNSSYGTESSHKIQILTREQVEYLLKNGGSSIALVQDINGTSTTAAPSQNAVATALQGYVSGVKSDGKQRAAITNLYTQNLGFNSYNSYCPTVTTKSDGGATLEIALMGRDAAIDHFLSKDEASSTYAPKGSGSSGTIANGDPVSRAISGFDGSNQSIYGISASQSVPHASSEKYGIHAWSKKDGKGDWIETEFASVAYVQELVAGAANAQGSPATASIGGWNYAKKKQSVYTILTEDSSPHASSEKYGVLVAAHDYDTNNEVDINIATVAYVQELVADLQSKIDALTKRVAALEAKG